MKVNFKSKKTKVILIVVSILVVLSILIGLAVSSINNVISGFEGMVQVVEVEKRDLSESISLSGTVKGVSTTNVTSKAAAEFIAVNVSVGDQVQQGDVLAVLDSSEIENQISSLNKSISNANALAKISDQSNQQALQDAKDAAANSLSDAQKTIDRLNSDYSSLSASYTACQQQLNAKNTEKAAALAAYNTAKAAYDSAVAAPLTQQEIDDAEEAMELALKTYSGIATECDALAKECESYNSSLTAASRSIEDARTTYDRTKSSGDKGINAAQQTIEASKYQNSDTTAADTLKKLKAQLEDCTVYAPCSGVVTSVKVSVGDNNTPGVAIITIEDTSSLVISTVVDEANILKLQEGMKATVTTVATGDRQMSGTVSRVVRVKSAGGVDGTAGGYAAEIVLQDEDLLVGMTAKAKIVLQERGEVMSIPYDYIQTDDAGNTFVMVAEEQEDGTFIAVKKMVTVGEEINYYTEVTGGDLKVGDRIFFDTAIEEGAQVTPADEWANLLEGQ